jgi:hypothetical protein
VDTVKLDGVDRVKLVSESVDEFVVRVVGVCVAVCVVRVALRVTLLYSGFGMYRFLGCVFRVVIDLVAPISSIRASTLFWGTLRLLVGVYSVFVVAVFCSVRIVLSSPYGEVRMRSERRSDSESVPT